MSKTLVIGLTGGIATGKSTVADMLRERGARIFDADAHVHLLLKSGGAAAAQVTKLFPEAQVGGNIDRAALGRIVFADKEKKRALEAILHPMVREAEIEFIQKAKEENAAYAVLEIPLLFESGSDAMCDFTVTTECPYEVQLARALARPHMSREKFEQIYASQMPQDERRRKADWVVPTGMSTAETRESVDDMLRALENRT